MVVDLPLDDAAAGVIREETGIRLGGLARPMNASSSADPCAVPEGRELRVEASPTVLSWVNFLDVTDWNTGGSCKLGLQIQPSLTHVYRRTGAEWQLVHRHADPLVDEMSLDDLLARMRS